jgi:hypothetical protein
MAVRLLRMCQFWWLKNDNSPIHRPNALFSSQTGMFG